MTENLIKRLRGISKRQRVLACLLIMAIFLNVYLKQSYMPRRRKIRDIKIKNASLEDRLLRLKSQVPDLKKEKDVLDSARGVLSELSAELDLLEARLPVQGRISELLGDWASRAEDCGIDLISIRPKVSRQVQDYDELSVDIKFLSNYSNMVNYLNKLEAASKFLNISDISMRELQKGSADLGEVTLTLTTLLGERSVSRAAGQEEAEAVLPLVLARDPFVSDLKPAKEAPVKEKEEYSVAGIISSGKHPTAIINGVVYRLGDEVGARKVKKIAPDRVVLTDGISDIVLEYERK